MYLIGPQAEAIRKAERLKSIHTLGLRDDQMLFIEDGYIKFYE